MKVETNSPSPKWHGLPAHGFLFVFLLTTPVQAADHTRLDYFTDQQGHPRPLTTPDEWPHRRAEILVGMQQVMGPLPDRTHLPALDPKITATQKTDRYEIQSLTFLAETFPDGDDRIPALLLIPPHPPGQKLPAILALHQTTPQGKRIFLSTSDTDQYAVELAQRGYIVLCPDYPSFGDYPYSFKRGNYLSGTMKGIFNHMRCVDLLQSRDDVDPDRIAVIGHSLGGHNAIFLAAFDPRIKPVVASCGWTPFADYYHGNLTGWTSDRYMPRIRDAYALDPQKVPFDFPEVIAALAPRPFFSNSPLHDANFDAQGVQKAITAVTPIYKLLNADSALQIRYPDATHSFPAAIRKEAYEFLDRVLKRQQ